MNEAVLFEFARKCTDYAKLQQIFSEFRDRIRDSAGDVRNAARKHGQVADFSFVTSDEPNEFRIGTLGSTYSIRWAFVERDKGKIEVRNVKIGPDQVLCQVQFDALGNVRPPTGMQLSIPSESIEILLKHLLA